MNLFGVHVCHEEILAFVAGLPVLGFAWLKLVNLIHKIRGCLCPKKR